MSRPSDARDEFRGSPEVLNPRLGPVEWLRWAWRQLTSMRTALLLLLALAVAAVPGSLLPQESADPNGVIQWKQSNPSLVGVVDALQGFDVYTSVWFSAIYLLLFISLVGCVIPRVAHHLKAMRAAPPRTPTRFGRLPASAAATLPGVGIPEAVDSAERLLKRKGYRVVRYGDSVSAERGYLRETGNLVFHTALVGVLITVFVGGGFTWTGQVIVTDGGTFVNGENAYDSLNKGRFFSDSSMTPYALTLDRLDVTYEQRIKAAIGQPIDYTAHVTTQPQGGRPRAGIVKVNEPLEIAGTSVYLLGNGYAARLTIRNAAGKVVYQDAVPFRPVIPQVMTSLGVVKVPDTGDDARQIGLRGFLYPTAVEQKDGSFASIYPAVGTQTLVSFLVYEGSVGLDSGVGQNVYELDTTGMKQVAGIKDPVQLSIGQTKALPDGLGSVTLNGVTRYAAFDVHHDPSQGWVALFVGLAVAGLITSLLVPRRRLWVKAAEGPDGAEVEYAGLARGDDPNLARAVEDLRRDHAASLEPALRQPA